MGVGREVAMAESAGMQAKAPCSQLPQPAPHLNPFNTSFCSFWVMPPPLALPPRLLPLLLWPMNDLQG